MVKLLGRVVLLIVVLVLCLNFSAQVTSADGGNHLDAHQVSWSDVSIPAQYRNKADWLLDMGKITKAEAFGPFKGKSYKVGDTEKFIALDFLGGPQRTLTARLMLVTDHAYWWFEDGVQPDQTDLEKAGSFFEKQIYPLDTSLFGNIWSPGIDGDPHVFILHQKQLGSYAVGVFSPKDECAKTLCPDSNQHQMVYYGMNYGPVNSPLHLSVIAHEFQHLIQYNVDGGEQRWLNEGLSQLAELLNGFNPRTIADSNLRSFLEDPNFQLDSWPTRAETDPAVNYAASYIFCVYLYQRFGTPFIQHLSRSPYKGLASVEETLKAMNTSLTLDQVFSDFTITNYLDSPLLRCRLY